MRTPEVMPSEPEYRPELAVERQWCLRALLSQASGRKVDPVADHYLIEQLNASFVGRAEAGAVTECKVDDCALLCLTTNESGVLDIVAERGETICDPTEY